MCGIIILVFLCLAIQSPKARHRDLFVFVLAIADFGSDVWFAYTLKDNIDFTSIYYSQIAFTSFPFLANLIVLTVLIYQEMANFAFRRWLENNFLPFTAVLLVSCTSMDSMFVLESRVCSLPCLQVPWSQRMVTMIRMFGLITILFEDIPQVCMQIYVISNSTYALVNVIGLATSSLGIMFGITKRILVCCVYHSDQRDLERQRNSLSATPVPPYLAAGAGAAGAAALYAKPGLDDLHTNPHLMEQGMFYKQPYPAAVPTAAMPYYTKPPVANTYAGVPLTAAHVVTEPDAKTVPLTYAKQEEMISPYMASRNLHSHETNTRIVGGAASASPSPAAFHPPPLPARNSPLLMHRPMSPAMMAAAGAARAHTPLQHHIDSPLHRTMAEQGVGSPRHASPHLSATHPLTNSVSAQHHPVIDTSHTAANEPPPLPTSRRPSFTRPLSSPSHAAMIEQAAANNTAPSTLSRAASLPATAALTAAAANTLAHTPATNTHTNTTNQSVAMDEPKPLPVPHQQEIQDAQTAPKPDATHPSPVASPPAQPAAVTHSTPLITHANQPDTDSHSHSHAVSPSTYRASPSLSVASVTVDPLAKLLPIVPIRPVSSTSMPAPTSTSHSARSITTSPNLHTRALSPNPPASTAPSEAVARMQLRGQQQRTAPASLPVPESILFRDSPTAPHSARILTHEHEMHGHGSPVSIQGSRGPAYTIAADNSALDTEFNSATNHARTLMEDKGERPKTLAEIMNLSNSSSTASS